MKTRMPKLFHSVRLRSRSMFGTSKLGRSAITAGGLATAAIIVGVALYAQAGLLLPKQSENDKHQTTRIEEVAESADNKATLGQTTIPPKPESQNLQPISETPPADKPISKQSSNAAKKTEPVCDEVAKTAAKLRYDRALAAEDQLHRSKLSKIGFLSKLMTLAHLSKDRVTAEKMRHDAAVEKLDNQYQQALLAVRCTR